jgi:copper oxidase (laccase) domain-containing protein
MAEAFGLDPAELRAGLSPTLGPCCAEFKNYRSYFPPELWGYADGRDHFDLVALARDQLVGSGLKRDRVEALGLCTRCRGDLFFSHRGQGPTTGRMGLAVGFRG